MKYLFCYDVHNSEENRANYEKMMKKMNERFGPMIQFTESVYLFETRPTDLNELRHEIQDMVDFIPDLEFYVFQLVDEMDNITTVKYCREIIKNCLEENRRLFAELGGG